MAPANPGLLGLSRLRLKAQPDADLPTDTPRSDSSASASAPSPSSTPAVREVAMRGGGGDAEPQAPLSPVSQMFLGMGEQAPDIYAILRLRGRAMLEDIVPAMQQLIDAHARFRMRVLRCGGSWTAETVDDFDVRWCMREVTLDGPDIDAAFNTYCAELMSGPSLAEGLLPPWDCSVVRFSADATRTAVLLRCSHMIGDGQLFMQLLRDVLEEADGSCADAPVTPTAAGVAAGAAAAGPNNAVLVAAPACGGFAVRAEEDKEDASISSSSSPLAVAAAALSEASARSEASAAGAPPSPSASCSSLQSLSPGGSGAGGAAGEKEGLLLIKAGREGSAFLPPPSMERGSRGGGARRRRGGALGGAAEGCGEGALSGRRGGPAGAGRRMLRLLLAFWSWISSALFVIWMPLRLPDPVNAVKASALEIGGPRSFASVTLPLDEMRHVSRILGVTINTLAVSCIAGGLRRHLLSAPGGGGARQWPWRRGRAGPAGASSSSVPASVLLCSMVDTRAMKQAGMKLFGGGSGGGGGGGANTLSFIGVPVHTGPAAPLARLAAVDASLAWVRGGLAVLIAIFIPPVLQFFLRDVGLATRVIMWMLPSKTTLGFSNMRGPVRPVALRGFPVERMYNGVQPNAFGCFLSLMSYDNQVTIVNSCYASKSDRPDQLLRRVAEEWAALRDAATVRGGAEEAACGGGGAPGKAKAA